MSLKHCPGCGALAPTGEGPVHPYIASSPGCWALYGEVLAREYGEYGYPPIHRLTVDAYAVQHPGGASRRATQSVAVHLAGLQLVLECGYDFARATETISAVLGAPGPLPRFAPPPGRGALTILDVHAAPDFAAHVELVNRWAESAWEAWAEHHAAVHRWLDTALIAGAQARR